MSKIIFSTILIFLIFSNSFSQNSSEKIKQLIEEGKEKLQTNLDSSLTIFQEALKLSQNNNEQKFEAQIIGEIGKVYYFMNDLDLGIEFFQRSLDFSKRINYYLQAGKMANNLGLLNIYIQEYAQSIIFLKEGLFFYEKIPDSIGIVDTYNNMGTYYIEIEELDSAILFYEKSLSIASQINNLENIATIHSNMAIVFHTKGNLSSALEHDFKAAKIFKEIKDIHNMAITIGNIGAIYLDNENYEQAIKYLLEADNLKDSVFIEDYYLKSNLLNIGIAYRHKKEYDKAEEYFQKSLEINKNNQDIKGEVNVYLNFIQLSLDAQKFNEALSYGNKALQLSESIESEYYIASSCKLLGRIYNSMGKYALAVKYLNIAYEKATDEEYLTYILDILDEQKIAYSNLNDYKNAFFVDEKIIMFTDSLSGIETQKELASLTTKYETEKKEQEIEQQKLKIAKQNAESKTKDLRIKQGNTIIFSVAIVLLLMFLLTFILFRSIKQKKKANLILAKQKQEIEEKNEELKQQSEEILIQNETLQQQKEEIEAQRDEITEQRDEAKKQKQEIISSITYAERIQRAVLPSEHMVKEILHEHFVFFKPRDIVSGDFYWLKQIKNFTIVATVDCTGHGVPGAFMSMLGTSFLNEIVTLNSLDNASEILNKLRLMVKKSLRQHESKSKDGMDIAFYIINKDTLELQFSGAYNPLYIIRNEESQPSKTLITLKADRQPIGIYLREKDFTNQNFQLEKDDCLYTFSDGYADQFGGKDGEKFKIKRFKELLLSIANKPMQEQKQIIDKTFNDWISFSGKKGRIYEQIDDVLVVGVKI